jgi:LacI family transcriptional regulator
VSQSITLRDIAKVLNLSVATVSRALRDSYDIATETKKRVQDYAKEIHYVPNRMAQGLKVGRTKSIGVVISSLDNNFVAEMLDGIHSVCTDKGYQLIIMQSKESAAQEKNSIEWLYAGGIEGLLISPALETTDFSQLQNLQENGLPVVLFDRWSDKINAHKIGADNRKGAYDATIHLLNNGYRAIAHIMANAELSIADERLKGYRDALQEYHITFRPELLRFCDYTSLDKLDHDLNEAVNELMNLPDRPDAFFTGSDQISTGCVKVLKQRGFKIPDDVAMIGFTNTAHAEIFDPPLSTVHQPAFEIGKLAAGKLFSALKRQISAEEYETVNLHTEIRIRASSAAKQ